MPAKKDKGIIGPEMVKSEFLRTAKN